MKNINLAKKLFWGTLPFHRKGPKSEGLIPFLRKVHLFENLKSSHLKSLSSVLHERVYEQKEFVFEANQPGTALFIIESGAVNILNQDIQGQNQVIVTLDHGDFFGELALLDRSPRSAAAQASCRTRIYALYRDDLQRMLETNPHLASRVYQRLAIIVGERLKETNRLIENQQSSRHGEVA